MAGIATRRCGVFGLLNTAFSSAGSLSTEKIPNE
jgi:hypothetical protein